LRNIAAGLTDLESQASEMEEAAMGPKENRLNQITVEEVNARPPAFVCFILFF
jgi:hypothetical protein